MELRKAIDRYVEALNSQAQKEGQSSNYLTIPGYKYRVEYLKKYARVVMERLDASGRNYGSSVHSFVVLADGYTKALGQVRTGDVMKPATWNKPAKHARGTVFTDKWNEYGASIYGANYLV